MRKRMSEQKMISKEENIKEVIGQISQISETGRSVDISDILQMYDECGYHCSNVQKTFLQKYAYIELHYKHPIWKQDVLIRLNPIEAQKTISMDVVEQYNDSIHDNLLIIGDIEKENMTLFLSESGFYFTGFDDCLINWGTSLEAMINKLMTGAKGEMQIID